MKAAAALLVALMMASAVAPTASAHAFRIAAEPAEDAVLAKGPDRVSATFSEPLQPAFAAMTVVGPDGNLWSTGDPEVQGAVVSIAVAPLGPPGTYTANYRVTSADGHVVTGSWSFQVTTPSRGTPGPAVPAVTPPSPADDGIPVWPFLAGAAVLVAVLAWWMTSRVRKRR